MALKIISDLHINDTHILKYRPEFKTIEAHDAFIFESWNQSVDDRDEVIIVGDICKGGQAVRHILKNLPGRKHIVLGNWDAPAKVWIDEGFDSIHACIRLFGYDVNDELLTRNIISHFPIDPAGIPWDYNIHGHIHRDDPEISSLAQKHINVSADIIGYNPIDVSSIIPFPVERFELVFGE